MTVAQAIESCTQKMRGAGLEDAAFEARELVAALCPFPRGQLNLHYAEPFERMQELEDLLRRRIDGEPLQYLLGEWEFMSLPFYVGEGVLIPRPETEILAEFAIRQCGAQPLRVADLCSGSGCIGISVAKFCPNAHVWLVEKSERAFSYLTRNVQLNGVENVTPVQGDIFAPDLGLPAEKFDLILSNPPYIRSDELPTLQREVQREPSAALDGGADGLDFYRGIAAHYSDRVAPGGWLAVEYGDGQEQAVMDIFKPHFSHCEIVRDLNAIERVLLARK